MSHFRLVAVGGVIGDHGAPPLGEEGAPDTAGWAGWTAPAAAGGSGRAMLMPSGGGGGGSLTTPATLGLYSAIMSANRMASDGGGPWPLCGGSA